MLYNDERGKLLCGTPSWAAEYDKTSFISCNNSANTLKFKSDKSEFNLKQKKKTDISSYDFKYETSDKEEENFMNLKVSAGVKLEILCCQIDVKGTYNNFQEDKDQVIRCSAIIDYKRFSKKFTRETFETGMKVSFIITCIAKKSSYFYCF